MIVPFQERNKTESSQGVVSDISYVSLFYLNPCQFLGPGEFSKIGQERYVPGLASQES